MTSNRSSLKKMIIEGKIKKKKSGERTPMHWIDQIKTIIGYPLKDAIRLAENCKRWKEIVANLN